MRIIARSSLPLLLIGLLPTNELHAAPSLTITGRTQLRLTGVSRTPRGLVTIRGDLRDANLRSGLAGARVEVRLLVKKSFVRQLVETDRHGVFRVRWPLPLGSYPVVATYRGNRFHAPSRVGPSTLDVSKTTPTLELAIGGALDAGRSEQELLVGAALDGAPLDLAIEVFALRQRADTTAGRRGASHGQAHHRGSRNRGVSLGQLRTGPKGRAKLTVATAKFGSPGPVALIARFAGDPNLNAASVRVETMLITPVKLELVAEAGEVAADGRIVLRGAVSDLLGPVSGGTVGLDVLGRHGASTITDSNGRFVFALPAEGFPPGTLELEARFTPVVLWRRPHGPARVEVKVLPPRPIPFWVYAVPAAGSALVLALLLAIRFRPRLRWPRRERRRRARGDEAGKLGGEPARPLASGVRLSRGRLRRLLVADHGVDGVVWDAADEVAVAGAVVELTPVAGGGERRLASGPNGAFVAEDLAPGRHRVVVTKPGYVSERFEIQVPHRGNLRGLRVLVVPIRVRVLELYRGVAQQRLPRPALWARWTPRELLDHLEHEGQDDGRVTALSDLLEGVYWGPPPPAESAVERAKDLTQAIDGPA